jgi:hypothetical protein
VSCASSTTAKSKTAFLLLEIEVANEQNSCACVITKWAAVDLSISGHQRTGPTAPIISRRMIFIGPSRPRAGDHGRRSLLLIAAARPTDWVLNRHRGGPGGPHGPRLS